MLSGMDATFRMRELADRQWRDYRQRTPGTYFGEPDAALGLADAYGIQAEVARLRCEAGDAIAGYKVGCIGPGVVEQFGMSGPIFGRLYRSELRQNGVSLPHAEFANLAIEAEMAVRIGEGGVIRDALPIIELHHFIFRGKPKTLAELVANNGINGGVVLADERHARPLEFWRNARELAARVNGEIIDRGALWAMPGGAEEAVDWLAGRLAQHGLSLKAGDLVLTGTPLGLYPVSPNDTIFTEVDGQPFVTCHVT